MVCLLAVLMLGASDPGERYSRVGHNLMCVCGCGQVLLECNHVGCPDSRRMIGELSDQLAGPSGTGADALVLNWFVNKYGATVLAAPIRGGFDNVAWIIPIGLFLFGTLGTAWIVRSWAQRRQAIESNGHFGVDLPNLPGDQIDQALLDRIRRETQY